MTVVNKHVEKAERLLQKGKIEDALEEYRQAWREEPANDSLVLTIADLYQRLNNPLESRKCHAYLFDKYAERNDVTKAAESFRKMQRLGPVDPPRLIRFAQLLEKSKPEESIEHYTRALDAVLGQEPEMALQCLHGLAGLQPSSAEAQARIAAVALKMGKTDLAVAAYHKVGQLRMDEGRYAEAAEALEEACRLPGGPDVVLLDLARVSAKAGRFARVAALLGEAAQRSRDPEILELAGQAYFAEKQFDKAEQIYGRLLELSPAALNPLVEIALVHLRGERIAQGLRTLQAIEQQLTASRQQRTLEDFAGKLNRIEHTHIPVLEFVSGLFDRLHLDSPLFQSLHRLFDRYYDAGEFQKAARALERLIDIDLYAPECTVRLERLEGKVEPSVWEGLASRMGRGPTTSDLLDSGPAASAAQPDADPETPTGSSAGSALRDLMLQAEIFLQYKLLEKARERLERIAKLCPHEEDKNEELKALYEQARFKPQYADAPAPVAAQESADLRGHYSRVSEISRNLARQSTVKGVLSTAVNGVGRHWQASRCVAGLLAPNRPPSMALEYISTGVPPSEPVLLGRLLMGLQPLTAEQGSLLVVENVSKAPLLASLHGFLATLQVDSLAAILLRDGDEPIGLLVLEQCGGPRAWKPGELAGLEALAGQIVLSVTNVRLRNLMKALAVTDERSGLLHRESYIPCLLSEAERTRNQKAPLTGAVLQFSAEGAESSGQPKRLEEFIRDFSVRFASHLRQNDIAVNYGRYALALILPSTTAKEAMVVVEKLRKLAASPSSAGGDGAPGLDAVVGEAVQAPQMETVDIVTELINRLERAVEEAGVAGSHPTRLVEPPALQL